MKVNVTATRCIVENDVELNAGEYNINKFYFTFSPEYLDNYVKKALFVAKDKPPIEMVIANDECNIPYDILKKPGVYMVGVYAYEIDENNELILRYSPEPTHFYVNRGSYIENAETPTEPDPDEFAQYYQAMQDLIAAAKPEFKEYIDENLPTVEVGEVETLPPGSQVIITNSGTDRHPILNFGIPEGKKGDTIDQIEIESDEENYQFKIKIYDNDGKLISESNMVDLPIEIFVKNTDYATENVGGVIKSSSNSGFVVDKNTGKVTGVNTSYSDLSNKDDKYLISKGTLDKYVTGKRLVSRTDYADSTTAGVIKVGTNADVDSNGYLKGNVLTYNQYLERNAENFISKGTLENLLRTRDYLKSSDAESTYSTINETGKTIELDINNSTYAMTITLKDKNGNTLSSDTIDLPLETMVVDAYYDKYSKEIVLTLQSGTSTRFSVADLVSGLQSEITSNNKLKSDLVDDTNQVHKFVTSEEKTTWNNKVDSSVTRSSHSGDFSSAITNNGNMVMLRSSYTDDGNTKNSVLALGSSGFSIIVDDNTIIETDQNNKLLLKNVINPVDNTDAANKKYVDDTIEANNIDVQINESSIVSDNVANISVTDGYNETDSPLLSLYDVTIDGSIPLGTNENSININTTSGNYDGTSVLLATNDTLESDYVPISADAAMQGTNYSSSMNNVGYQIDFSIMNNTTGDSNSILFTPTETYIGNVKDPENDGDAVNKKYVDDAVSDKSDFSGSYNDLSDKPTIPTQLDELSDDSAHRLVTDNEKSTWNGKQDTINDLETIRSGAASGKTAVQFNDLATVATSGSYNDLSNKPTIPTKLSQLSDDSAHRLVSDTEKTTWNNKSDFSGSYNDLSNKPTIPTSTSQLTNNSNFVSDSAYVHTDNNYTDNEKNKLADLENYDDTEVKESITDLNNSIITIGKIKADKTSIPKNTSDLNNDSGYITKNVNDLTHYTLATDTGSFIDLEINTTTYVVTLSLKNSEGTVISSDSIDLPLENVVVSGSYNNSNQKIILTLQNGTTVDIPVGDLVAGLQTEITSSNKIASDLIDDSNSGNKFVTTSEKSTWNGKQNAITSSNKLSTSLISGLATVATSGSYNDLTDVPTIPTQVTESTVSGWGFTKNTGTYIKPSTGIPKTDLASGVQTSLGKADTALQSISSSDVTTALGYTPYNSTNPNGYTSNTGTITGVKMNGSTIASSGVADLGTVITEHQDISGKQDKIVAGTNISIASDGKTISATDTTYSNATTTTAGLMSSDDKTKLNGIETGATKNLNYYGTCATAATKQAKVVVCDGFILENGATISVLFTYGQSYNGVLTLNVNSTGAKNIRYKADTNAVQYIWSAGEIIDFTYNGTYWIMHRSALATTLYYGLAKYSDSLTSTSSALGATPKAINTAMINIISGAPIYSASSTYNVGDRVRYSNNVWECVTAITTAEAWTEAHWQTVAPLQEQIDDKQDAITSSNKLSSDLVSDVNSTNKFITSTERTTWNSKQSLLVSGTNIKTINNESILGSGNITIEGGGTVNTYYLVNILNMTSTSDATYEIVNDLINNNQFVIFDDPDGRSRELFCYVPIKTYYQSDLDIQTFWYIDNQDKYNLVVITHSGTSVTVIRTTYHSIEEAYNLADGKQNALVSGTNIKTINNESILGSGNITVEANNIDVQINNTSIVSNNVANISVTGSYERDGSPLLSLYDVTIDGSIPLGPDEDSININTTSGNYDGTSVLLVTSDTLESEVGDIESILTILDTGSGV